VVVGPWALLRLVQGRPYPWTKSQLLDLVRDKRARWVKADGPVRVRLRDLVRALPERLYPDEARLVEAVRQTARRLGLPG